MDEILWPPRLASIQRHVATPPSLKARDDSRSLRAGPDQLGNTDLWPAVACQAPEPGPPSDEFLVDSRVQESPADLIGQPVRWADIEVGSCSNTGLVHDRLMLSTRPEPMPFNAAAAIGLTSWPFLNSSYVGSDELGLAGQQADAGPAEAGPHSVASTECGEFR